MTNLGDKKSTVPTTPINSTPTQPTAIEVLTKFLNENNIELRMTPLAQSFEDGSIVIRPQQIVAVFKQKNSIANG